MRFTRDMKRPDGPFHVYAQITCCMRRWGVSCKQGNWNIAIFMLEQAEPQYLIDAILSGSLAGWHRQ